MVASGAAGADLTGDYALPDLPNGVDVDVAVRAVNAIGPGPVLKSIHQTEEDFAQEARSTLLQRGSSPAEIAAAIRFILDCPAMTGQMLALDGGQHLMWSDTAHPASATVGPGNDPSQQ